MEDGINIDLDELEISSYEDQKILNFKTTLTEINGWSNVVSTQSFAILDEEEENVKQGGVLDFSDNPVVTNYSGNIYVTNLNGVRNVGVLTFTDGVLTKTAIDESEPVYGENGCSPFRRVLAYAGYRIERYNIAEQMAFTVGFPTSLLWEMASCVVDGCPYQ